MPKGNERLQWILEFKNRTGKGTQEALANFRKLDKATVKNVGNVKRQSRSFTQLAYALDDAQYGFRGVQNNLQQIAVQSGIGGPAILGITALTIAIGYLIDHWDELTTSTTKATKALDDYYKKEAERGKTEEQKLLEARIEESKREISVLQNRKKFFDEGNRDIRTGETELSESDRKRLKFLLRQRELDQQAISAIENKKKVEDILAKSVDKTNKEYQKQIKAIKDTEDIAPYRGISGLEGYFNDPGLFDVFSDRGVGDPFELSPDPEVLDEWDDWGDDLEQILKDTGSALYGLSEDQAKAFLAITDAQQTTAEKTQDFAGALIGAFDSAASQGGNFIENLAKGIMSSLGSILIQQGTAAIFSGIAKNAIVPGSGADSIKKGALVTAAGIALKAGANIGNKNSGGGSTPGSRSSASAPVSAFSPTNQGFNVSFEIGNDKLIGSLEQGLNKRGTFLGTNQLTPG